MPRLTTKTLEEILEAARELLQDSTVSEVYELTYQAAITNYILPGFTSQDPRVLSIETIEGVNLAGNYITEADLTVGIDYELYQQYGIVDQGYGAASGLDFYRGITIATLSFKDNSIVYIRYKYQSPDFLPSLTNFAGNAINLMFLAAVFSNVQQDLVTLAGSIEEFGITATGDVLKGIGSIVDEEETTAIETTGIVQIINSSLTESFSITSGTRFVARAGGTFIQFKAVTGSGSIAANSISNISVVAVVAGKSGNVGPYSIVEIYEDAGLTVLAPSYLTVSNPPLISGEPNEFNNGADAESDDQYRLRIQLAFQSALTSSYSTVEKAAFDTGYLSDVRAFDQNNRKGISPNNNIMTLQTLTGNILSATTISIIQAAVLAVAGTGQQFRFEQTMSNYLSFNFDVYVDAATLEDTSVLEDQIINTLTSHIQSKGIGEDIFPSTILSLIVSNVSVRDAVINNIKTTEYVSEPFATDVDMELSDNTGVEQNRFALQLPFNSIVRSEVDDYDGVNAYLDVANTPIDDRVNPRVQRAVLDYNNEYRASPLNIWDYFSSVSGSDTRINFEVAPVGQDPVIIGEDLIYDYNQYDNQTIDGIRIMLNGVDGQFVDVELRQGATPSTATLVHADTQKTITLDGNELPKVYEVLFTTPQVLTPASVIYWIFVKPGGTNSNVTSLPTDSTNFTVPFNPEIHIDGQGESSPGAPDGTYERFYSRVSYQSFVILSGSDAYNKIVIPSKSLQSESSILYDTDITFLEFIDE